MEREKEKRVSKGERGREGTTREERRERTNLPVGINEGGSVVSDVGVTGGVSSLSGARSGLSWRKRERRNEGKERVSSSRTTSSKREERTRLTSVSGILPDVSSPISTEGGIEDGEVIGEEGVGVTGGGREVGLRSSPSRGERLTGSDVGGDSLSREEEDRDTGSVPLH